MPKRSVDCSIRPNEISPDNDITGIGVTIGYTATAGIVVAIIVVHYLAIYEPDLDPFRKDNDTAELTNKTVHFRPNPVDKMVLGFLRRIGRKLSCGGRISSRTYGRLEEAFTKSVLSMSDAQIVTGISIFISGLAQLQCGLSTFEWQILVNLAWFSSLTHLSCLTVLRNYLHNHPVERAWRLLSMLVLVVMLSLALLPTANYNWNEKLWLVGYEPFHVIKLTDYAICYLKPDSRYQTLYGVLSLATSLLLIFLGFILRVIRLHQSFSSFVSGKIRKHLSEAARSLLRTVFQWCDRNGSPQSLKRLLCYRPLLALFLAIRILLDIWSSMLFEVWWLIVSFVWGTFKLMVNRDYHPTGNDKWTFGQVTSVLLLAIPLVTIFEYFYPDHKADQTKHPSSMATTTREQQSGSPLQTSTRPDPAFSTLSSSPHAVDDPDSDAFYDSGLLTMPALWTLLSFFPLSLLSAVSESYTRLSSMFYTADPLLHFESLWLYVLIIWYFFTLVIVVLFSFLISTRGSHARTQHPRCRRVFQITVALAFLGDFYLLFLVIQSGWLGSLAIPVLYTSPLAWAVIYVLCCLFFGVRVKYLTR